MNTYQTTHPENADPYKHMLLLSQRYGVQREWQSFKGGNGTGEYMHILITQDPHKSGRLEAIRAVLLLEHSLV